MAEIEQRAERKYLRNQIVGHLSSKNCELSLPVSLYLLIIVASEHFLGIREQNKVIFRASNLVSEAGEILLVFLEKSSNLFLCLLRHRIGL